MSMTELQRNLFRLPLPKRIELTPTQREVLAWVEFSGGHYTAWPRQFKPETLRKLIKLKLVKVAAFSPSRYVLTELGRAVRWRYASGERHKTNPAGTGKPPLATSQFFRDSED